MAIWKAKTASGVRAYFKVVSAGSLVAGLGAGAFNALLLNPGDTANQSLAVAQSAQQAGVYYVDIPSAFLTTHGAGAYGLSLGVHSVLPAVNDEVLYSLEVTVRDLDDIPTAVQNADSLLTRDMTAVEAAAAIQSLCSAILKLTCRFNSQTGRTYRVNGTTVHMTQIPVTAPAASPIVELGKGA